MRQTKVDLPPFRAMVVKASQALEDDSFMMELHHADSELLQATYKRGFVALESAHLRSAGFTVNLTMEMGS